MTLAFKYKLTNDQIKYKWIKIVYKFCSTFPYKELQAILAVNMCINISSQSTNKLPVGLVYHWSSCMDGSKKIKNNIQYLSPPWLIWIQPFPKYLRWKAEEGNHVGIQWIQIWGLLSIARIMHLHITINLWNILMNVISVIRCLC